MTRIVVVNGAIGGAGGNTARVLEAVAPRLGAAVMHLTETDTRAALAAIAEASGVVIATGTYWDSWGSPLQRFLEEATASEGTAAWLGKPAAVIVTEHAVGGKAVLSRLQGVLSTFGALIPPMSGMVYSLAAQLALAGGDDHCPDFWCPGDLEVVCHNLVAAVNGTQDWRAWPVDAADPRRLWVAGA